MVPSKPTDGLFALEVVFSDRNEIENEETLRKNSLPILNRKSLLEVPSSSDDEDKQVVLSGP